MYRYSLDSTKKFVCPSCGQTNKFVRYMDRTTGKYLSGKYGKCDRQDNCSYWEKPKKNFINDADGLVKEILKDLGNSDSLDSGKYLRLFHNIDYKMYYDNQLNHFNICSNTLLFGLIELFGADKVQEVYNKYKLGRFFDGGIIYPYYYDNALKTAKIMFYTENLHRNKFKNPMWLHSFKTYDFTGYNGLMDIADNPFFDTEYEYYLKHPDEYIDEDEEDIPRKFNLCIPLFGWDLLKQFPDKTICVVESEKTAIICSICFPEFNWLATGSKNNLQPYKFNYYSGRTWLFFPDLGMDSKTQVSTTDYWKQQVKRISEKYSMFDYFIDFVPEPLTPDNNLSDVFQQYTFNSNAVKHGYDVADFILDYKFKCNGYDNYISYMTDVLKPYK